MLGANAAAASGSMFVSARAAFPFVRRGSADVESELRELRVLHRDLKDKKKDLALRLKQKRQRDARLMAKVQLLVFHAGNERGEVELSIRVCRRLERYLRSSCRGSWPASSTNVKNKHRRYKRIATCADQHQLWFMIISVAATRRQASATALPRLRSRFSHTECACSICGTTNIGYRHLAPFNAMQESVVIYDLAYSVMRHRSFSQSNVLLCLPLVGLVAHRCF